MSTEIPHGENLIGLSVYWLDRLANRDFEGLWNVCHPMYRIVTAQQWLLTDDSEQSGLPPEGAEGLITTLATDFKSAPRSAEFVEFVLGKLEHLTPAGDWGPSTQVRVISPSIEAVAMVDRSTLEEDPSGAFVVPAGGLAWALSVFFEDFNGSPMVRGYTGLMEPGWPPTRIPVDMDSY